MVDIMEISLSEVVLVLIHLVYDVMLGVFVINSTCKDKRNSGNHDITRENPRLSVER